MEADRDEPHALTLSSDGSSYFSPWGVVHENVLLCPKCEIEQKCLLLDNLLSCLISNRTGWLRTLGLERPSQCSSGW